MIAGFIPGVGDVANGINAAISLARGNYKDAALYALFAIPFDGVLGEAAIAAREVETGINVGRELLLDTTRQYECSTSVPIASSNKCVVS